MQKGHDKIRKIRVGISHGDFNGVSYELILKAFSDNRLLDMCTPVIYGSSKIASFYRKALHTPDISFNLIQRNDNAHPQKVNLVNIHKDEVKIEMGKSTEVAGKLAYDSLEESVEGLKMNKIDVLVTAPINKHNIQSDHFDFPGHTEYLAKKFNADEHLMLMVCENVRLGVITGHLPLKDVSSALSIELIEKKVKTMNESLIKDFGIRKPKIALLGLNPHAGDGGLLGNEENEIIIPAVKKVFDQGILAYGPYPADGFFGVRQYRDFDGVLAMYHDQGMIAFKSLAFDSGVNFTAGLPIIRTSPAHGTAYNITGKDQASPESFLSAIYLAIDIFNNRKMHEKLNANPLQHAEIDENNDNADEDIAEN